MNKYKVEKLITEHTADLQIGTGGGEVAMPAPVKLYVLECHVGVAAAGGDKVCVVTSDLIPVGWMEMFDVYDYGRQWKTSVSLKKRTVSGNDIPLGKTLPVVGFNMPSYGGFGIYIVNEADLSDCLNYLSAQGIGFVSESTAKSDFYVTVLPVLVPDADSN